MSRCSAWLIAVSCCSTSLALASVGKVEAATGEAVRTPKGGEPVKLKKGARIELEDDLLVRRGILQLRLTDGSKLFLSEGAELKIDKASFHKLERESVTVRLVIGSLWAKVKRAAAGSEHNFEVVTDRAVAGVRGTEFRVDVRAPSADGEKTTEVRVYDGQVYVRTQGEAPAPAEANEAAAPSVASGALRGRMETGGPAPSSKMAAVPRPQAPAPMPMAEAVAGAGAQVLRLEKGGAVTVLAGGGTREGKADKGDDPFARFVSSH